MQLKLILKYFKTAFKDFKVFTGLGLHHLTSFTGRWVGGRVAWVKLEIKLSQPQLKLKLSLVEAELGNFSGNFIYRIINHNDNTFVGKGSTRGEKISKDDFLRSPARPQRNLNFNFT